MAHELTIRAGGGVEMAFQGGQLPWHGLGQPVTRGISTREMLKAALLDWPVKISQVNYTVEGVGPAIDSDHRIIYRGDTGAVLDMCGKIYEPFQNEEVLDFFRMYVDAGEMTLETAGSLNGGKQIWALARMEQGFTLPGKDRVEGYVLLMNPHQYGKGAILKFTPIRVVCANTMAIALRGGEGIKLWHNRKFDDEMQDSARHKLGIAREQLDGFADAAKKLSKWEMDEEQALTALQDTFGADPEKAVEEQRPTVQRLIDLWTSEGMGATLKSAKGTAWGLLNAVTQYYDHEYGKSIDSRMTNAWLGTGSVKKREVLNTLLAMGGDLKAQAANN